MIIFPLVFTSGALLGWALCAGYYASQVRAAFGLGDEVEALGYLRTKAIKRRVDESGKRVVVHTYRFNESKEAKR